MGRFCVNDADHEMELVSPCINNSVTPNWNPLKE